MFNRYLGLITGGEGHSLSGDNMTSVGPQNGLVTHYTKAGKLACVAVTRVLVWTKPRVGKPRVGSGRGFGGHGGPGGSWSFGVGFVIVVIVMAKPLLRPLRRNHRQDHQNHHQYHQNYYQNPLRIYPLGAESPPRVEPQKFDGNHHARGPTGNQQLLTSGTPSWRNRNAKRWSIQGTRFSGWYFSKLFPTPSVWIRKCLNVE